MKGLVLEGGGTKGSYQIGAYRALRDLGIEFKGVTGTSIGALNGAYIVQNDIEAMEDIWLNHDYTHFMNIDEDSYEKYKNIDFTTKNINSVIELLNKAMRNEGIDISPLRKLLQKTLNEEAVRKSKMDFGLVTVWWDKKINPQPMYMDEIPENKLIDYLIASASLPIFKLDTLDDKLFLDGMFFDNMPINMLDQKGYKDIVVIRLLDDMIGKRHLAKYKDREDLNIKTIVPSEYLGGSLNKDKDNVEKNVNLGYLDTMKSYNRYEGNRYYFNINSKYDENYCFEKLRSLDKQTIQNLCYLFGVKRDPNLRTLIEVIIPKVGESLNLSKEFTYKDLFYAIYEKKLEENSIDRLKLYDFNKVIEVSNKNINNIKLIDKEDINSLIYLQKNKFAKSMTNLIIKDLKEQ